MALSPSLPKSSAPVVTAKGLAATEWYDFFRLLRTFAGENIDAQTQIAALEARIEALEAGEDGPQLLGAASVRVFGTLADSLVQFFLDGDEAQPGNTYFYGTGPDGVKGFFAVADAVLGADSVVQNVGADGIVTFNLDGDEASPPAREVYGTDASGAKGWTPVLVENLAGSTYSTLQHYVNTMTSPGIITGCELSQLDTDTVAISAGTGMIRVADNDVSTLLFFDIAAATFDIPADQETRFYGVVYSAGAVAYEARLVDDWDKDTEIPLGSAVRFNGTMVVTPNKYRTGDPITNVIQRFYANLPASRDNSLGGLALGETGTRNVTVSAGRIWSRLSDFDVASKDSSVDSMVSVYFNGTNLTFTSGLSQWDNLQYNDMGTGALVTMNNNKYANLWFFVSIDGSQYGFAYGTAEYNTLGDAADEGIPPYLTQDFFNQSLLLGRFLFQKSAATASRIESAFIAAFSSAAINDHNSLGGLQGGTAGEFYHLTAAQAADLVDIGLPDQSPTDLAIYVIDSDGNFVIGSDGNFVVSLDATDDFWQLFRDREWDGALTQILEGAATGLVIKRYSDDAVGLQLRATKARGTKASPTGVLSGDTLLSFSTRAWHSGGDESGNVGAIEIKAAEDFTSTAQGTVFEMSTVSAGTTSRAVRLRLDQTSMRPASDNVLDLGTSAMRYVNGYVRQLRPGAGGVIWTSGTGTPEGAVTAPVGSLFTRTDGGAGTTLYVKESGAGSVGWVPK